MSLYVSPDQYFLHQGNGVCKFISCFVKCTSVEELFSKENEVVEGYS